LETLPHASKRLLQVQRCKLPGKRLSLPDGHKAVNGRAIEGADRRSLGLERYGFGRREPSSRREFCIMWLANSMLQLPLVNRFCILDIEKSNTSVCEPIVIFFSPPPSPPFSPATTPATWRLKWEKRLPKQLSVSALDIHRASLILTIELCTTDTSKVHSNKAFLDCGVTGSFFDRDFVYNKGINTQSISYPIPMFNVNGTPNKAGQISKVIDIMLWYNTHLKWILFMVSSLGKKDLILEYSWLKDHNLEVDWQRGKVLMTHCLPWCEGC